MWVSYETIYRSLYNRSKGVIHHSLTKFLRRGRPMRHSRNHRRSGQRTFTRLVDGVSIHERPKSVEKRTTVGHWEGDLISGSKNTHIATLVDKKALTWDRGMELAKHKELTKEIGIPVYFCDPQSPCSEVQTKIQMR